MIYTLLMFILPSLGKLLTFLFPTAAPSPTAPPKNQPTPTTQPTRGPSIWGGWS